MFITSILIIIIFVILTGFIGDWVRGTSLELTAAGLTILFAAFMVLVGFWIPGFFIFGLGILAGFVFNEIATRCGK